MIGAMDENRNNQHFRKRKRKTNKELNEVNHEARARGMSYGQYASRAYAPVIEKKGRIV